MIDINPTTYLVENTGTQLGLLNGCVAGSQNYNRDGRKITMKSLQIRGYIYPADSTTANANFVRFVIVYDKQSNGAAPTWSDVFTSQNISGTTDSGATSMLNLNNRDRFEIVRDKCWALGGIDNTATTAWGMSPGQAKVNMFIRLGNRTTTFNAGTAGTVGDITTGALYFFWIATNSNTTGHSARIACRVRFVDE